MGQLIQTPKRLAQARTILLLKDDNGTIIADSVSCVYKTKFQTSLLTYSGEVRRSAPCPTLPKREGRRRKWLK